MLVDDNGDICTKCGEPRPEAEFYHHPDGRRKNPCRICCRERGKQRYQEQDPVERRERAKQYWDAWYAKSKDDLLDRKRDKYYGRRERVRRYKITSEQYDAMLAAQGGVCALCEVSETDASGGILHVDHCHENGDVRWLLCGRCNRGIGLFLEQPGILRRAADMLEAHRAGR